MANVFGFFVLNLGKGGVVEGVDFLWGEADIYVLVIGCGAEAGSWVRFVWRGYKSLMMGNRYGKQQIICWSCAAFPKQSMNKEEHK